MGQSLARLSQGRARQAPGGSAAAFEHQLADRLSRSKPSCAPKSYRPGAYCHFFIHEPKRRKISAAPFRDRVVHHALCNLIEPIFDARSSPTATPTASARARTERWIGSATGAALSLRAARRRRQHFPSFDHAILRAKLARVIGDEDVRWLVDVILASGAGVLADEYRMSVLPRR